jgi:hypothetical protein
MKETAMSMKPYLFAATLAIVLGVGPAPAEAQFYGGRTYVGVGGGTILTPTTVVSPVMPYAYDPFVTPTSRVVVQRSPVVTSVNRVIVQPAPLLTPVNRVILQPTTVVAPLPYGVYYPRPRGLFGRRGWW